MPILDYRTPPGPHRGADRRLVWRTLLLPSACGLAAVAALAVSDRGTGHPFAFVTAACGGTGLIAGSRPFRQPNGLRIGGSLLLFLLNGLLVLAAFLAAFSR